ncbi:MAG: 30S ribosomal protein S2 [Alphaproteobacteria bacterium]|nr:30S ribosomal protein S2 [Alphaproteobacteria bacterium]
MSLPKFTLRELLEAGVHFGHKTRRWNPKMKPFIFGERNNIHIVNLEKTAPMIFKAMKEVSETVSKGGKVLFVSTKKQAQDRVKQAAEECGQYYVNYRWLGGMMTNWKTVTQSIKRLKQLEKELANEDSGRTKKETLKMTREYKKLDMTLGGIKDMGTTPDIMFVIDSKKEALAIAEANTLGIPVVGVVDTNSSPDGIDFLIPGNDDAIRAIDMYCSLISGAVLDGIEKEMVAKGVDLGEAEGEKAPAKKTAAKKAPAKKTESKKEGK